MKIVPYISLRYLRFKAHEKGISAITSIAFTVIVVSNMAAIVILGVLTGLQKRYESKIMEKDAHIVFYGPGKGISNYKKDMETLLKDPEVVTVYPFMNKQALLQGNFNSAGSLLKAVPFDLYQRDTEFRKVFRMLDGDFDLEGKNSIVLGESLARNLGVEIGDLVDVIVYSEEFMSLQYKFVLKGVFSAGEKSIDSVLAFINFDTAQRLFFQVGYADGIGVKVKHPYQVEQTANNLKALVPYHPFTWIDLNKNLLSAMQNERFVLKIAVFFFYLVVFFNILSTMIGMVLDRKEDIAILKAMGLEPKKMMRIFLLDGFLLGLTGGLGGILLGMAITALLNPFLKLLEMGINGVQYASYWILSLFTSVEYPEVFHFLDPSVYYMSDVPISILFSDVAFIFTLTLVSCILAVLFPAIHTLRIRPVEVLRNE